jgi:hypothetical protein
MAEQQHTSNAEAIADAKIPPGDDYEEIREQVRLIEAACVNLAMGMTLIVAPSFSLFCSASIICGKTRCPIAKTKTCCLLCFYRIDTCRLQTLPAL